VAIVLGHVNRGLAGSDVVDPSQSWYVAMDSTFYLFHLSCFALLSGCVVSQGALRLGEVGYTRSRLATFLYLYVLWSLLTGATRVLAGDSTNTPVEVSDVLRLWRPDSPLWFFGWLCVMTLFAVLFAPWRGGARVMWAIVSAAPLGLASWGWDGSYFGFTGLGLASFFILGVVGGTRHVGRLRTQRAFVLSVIALVAVAVFVLIQDWGAPVEPTINDPDRTAASVLSGVAASCFGTLAVLAIAALSSRLPQRAAQWAGTPGQNSLAIFLAHTTAAAGVRTLLVRAGVDDVVVHMVTGTVAGVVAPLMLLSITRRIGFPYLFGAPALLTAGSSTRAPGVTRSRR
jgi:fucose 4-O-acetylase-like acetyltransferase